MTLKQIIPWRWGGLRSWEGETYQGESCLATSPARMRALF